MGKTFELTLEGLGPCSHSSRALNEELKFPKVTELA